jgi:hypothetical protein
MRVRPLHLLLAFCALLFFLLRQARDGGNHAPDRPSARFAFVHVPKTGGQAVRRCAFEPSCSDVRVSPRAHDFTEANALAAGLSPIIVLRPPLERFKSAFTFWVSGSNDMRKHSPMQAGPLPRARACDT